MTLKTKDRRCSHVLCRWPYWDEISNSSCISGIRNSKVHYPPVEKIIQIYLIQRFKGFFKGFQNYN